MEKISNLSIIVVSCIVFGVQLNIVSGGGKCGAPERCCIGRDSSCFVNNNEDYFDDNNGLTTHTACYCDEGCLETGDCCLDYGDVCDKKVIHCEVSKWSMWSTCDRSCGKGIQSRTRLITQHPSPGGKRCPALSQKRACLGNRCSAKYKKYKSPIVETAALLPAKYLALKQQKPKWDVRENLFFHQKQLKQQSDLITKKKQKKSKFTKGINNLSQFYSENDIDMEGYQSDQPATNLEYCIVFELAKVTKACQRDKDFGLMEKGQQMCAFCPQDAKRESLGGRCRGHGVDSKLTRWRSTIHSKCHGKWRRVQETRKCPCKKGPDFIFV